MRVGLVEISRKDPSFYVITQKGIGYRSQFNSFVSMMEKDLEKLNHNESHEILASLKMKGA